MSSAEVLFLSLPQKNQQLTLLSHMPRITSVNVKNLNLVVISVYALNSTRQVNEEEEFWKGTLPKYMEEAY